MNMSARSCARSVAKGCQDKTAIASSIIFNFPCVILDKNAIVRLYTYDSNVISNVVSYRI